MDEFTKAFLSNECTARFNSCLALFLDDCGYPLNQIPQQSFFKGTNVVQEQWRNLLQLETSLAFLNFMKAEFIRRHLWELEKPQKLKEAEKFVCWILLQEAVRPSLKGVVPSASDLSRLIDNRLTYSYEPLLEEWKAAVLLKGPKETIVAAYETLSLSSLYNLFDILDLSLNLGWDKTLRNKVQIPNYRRMDKNTERIKRIETGWSDKTFHIMEFLMSFNYSN